jgi:hypothetical protein
MENSSDANPRSCPAKEHDVFAVLDSPHSRAKLVTSAAQVGRFSYALEAVYETIEVNLSLFSSPRVNRIVEDRLEIGFG